jgi:hypothetical protein
MRPGTQLRGRPYQHRVGGQARANETELNSKALTNGASSLRTLQRAYPGGLALGLIAWLTTPAKG